MFQAVVTSIQPYFNQGQHSNCLSGGVGGGLKQECLCVSQIRVCPACSMPQLKFLEIAEDDVNKLIWVVLHNYKLPSSSNVLPNKTTEAFNLAHLTIHGRFSLHYPASVLYRFCAEFEIREFETPIFINIQIRFSGFFCN